MKKIFEEIKQNRFLDFKGAYLQMKIPLREALLNQAIAESLQGDSIEKLRITILPENKLQIHISAFVKLIFKAKISRTIILKLQHTLKVDDQYNSMAEIESIEGGLGKTDEAIIQLLSKKINKDLPHYISFSDNQLKINAYQLLVNYGLESAVDYIDQLYVSTESTGPNESSKIWLEGVANI